MSWAEALRMPWGVCRMLFMARAEAYDNAHPNPEETRYATADDIANWI